MSLDPCQLTADVLPLLADDLLSPETRQFVLAHAAGCAECSRLLAAARAGQAAPGLAEPPPASEGPGAPEASARRFFRRLRRLAVYGLALAVLLMVGVGSVAYQLGHRPTGQPVDIPLQVASAEDLARRAVPGWTRAEAQGLVVPLGITEHIPKTDATITLEQAWYSGEQVYILYTVQAPANQFLVPTASYLIGATPGAHSYDGGTDWQHLSRWGGFSRAGFHSVFSFGRLNPPPPGDRLKLVIRTWTAVAPKTGASGNGTAGGEVTAVLPWHPEYLQEPAPEHFDLTARHTWLGRTLSLERLDVGTGRMTLSGWIDLPAGEANPGLIARLHVGNGVREMKEYHTDPAGAPGRYHFTTAFDGPDAWPQPVSLELTGIGFEAQRTLEWTFPWARYRDQTQDWRRTLDQAEQFEVRFYDSALTTIGMTVHSLAIEQKDTTTAPPYVRAALGIGGRLDDSRPGWEIAGPDGAVLRNLGGSGGVIWDEGGIQHLGVGPMWDVKLFPPSFHDASRLTLRYVRPSATLMLKETWQLLPVK